MTIRDFWNVELEDDEKTNFGGIAFSGETVGDFMQSLDEDPPTTIRELNSLLVECGIKPIDLHKSM